MLLVGTDWIHSCRPLSSSGAPSDPTVLRPAAGAAIGKRHFQVMPSGRDPERCTAALEPSALPF